MSKSAICDLIPELNRDEPMPGRMKEVLPFTSARRRTAAMALSILLFGGSALQAAVPSEFEAFPLRRPDRSSPRDTLRSFLETSEATRAALLNEDAEAAQDVIKEAVGFFARTYEKSPG